MKGKICKLFLVFAVVLLIAGANRLGLLNFNDVTPIHNETENTVLEDKVYYSKDEVALFVYTYEKLPKNFITKNEASKLGWISNKGNLWEVTDKLVIGGDRFGNREGVLPNRKGRVYYEADVDYNGGFRDSKRIVFSNDGLIYYTGDHYKSFNLLYGEE